MSKVIKPGTSDQPAGVYIEVESGGGMVDGGATIEIERGDIATNAKA